MRSVWNLQFCVWLWLLLFWTISHHPRVIVVRVEMVTQAGFCLLCQANHYYKLFITWTSQKIKKTFVHRNMFEFKHIKVCVAGLLMGLHWLVCAEQFLMNRVHGWEGPVVMFSVTLQLVCFHRILSVGRSYTSDEDQWHVTPRHADTLSRHHLRIREMSSHATHQGALRTTVISAHWITVDWSWLEE